MISEIKPKTNKTKTKTGITGFNDIGNKTNQTNKTKTKLKLKLGITGCTRLVGGLMLLLVLGELSLCLLTFWENFTFVSFKLMSQSLILLLVLHPAFPTLFCPRYPSHCIGAFKSPKKNKPLIFAFASNMPFTLCTTG